MKEYPKGLELETVSCPNGCPNVDELVLVGKDRLHGIAGEFSVYRCKCCNLERTSPRPTAETINIYYPEEYAPYRCSSQIKKTRASAFKQKINNLLGIESRVLPNIQPGKMLEFGCSSGDYMEKARSLGWNVEGVEFSEHAATIARSRGFNVSVGAIENIFKDAQNYDIIVGWMVLEHLHQPVNVLKKLNTWIKRDGYLVISIPEAKSLARKLFNNRCYDLHLPNHLFHFTPESLVTTLAHSGWKVERMFWQRNCNTLLYSFQYWADDTNRPVYKKIAKWVISSRSARYVRLSLSVLLGIFHLSGRIEVWARPIKDSDV